VDVASRPYSIGEILSRLKVVTVGIQIPESSVNGLGETAHADPHFSHDVFLILLNTQVAVNSHCHQDDDDQPENQFCSKFHVRSFAVTRARARPIPRLSLIAIAEEIKVSADWHKNIDKLCGNLRQHVVFHNH
jgi:hypothetical protein